MSVQSTNTSRAYTDSYRSDGNGPYGLEFHAAGEDPRDICLVLYEHLRRLGRCVSIIWISQWNPQSLICCRAFAIQLYGAASTQSGGTISSSEALKGKSAATQPLCWRRRLMSMNRSSHLHGRCWNPAVLRKFKGYSPPRSTPRDLSTEE